MKQALRDLEQTLGRPIANASFALMRNYIRSAQRRGVSMLHTARPFSFYRKVFYQNQPARQLLADLQDKTIIDVGCGYTPFADDSMFQACQQAGVDFYGIDPLIGEQPSFGLKERALARATGSRGYFQSSPPGIEKALAATAEDLPFADDSVDEILCSFLLFVWIKDESKLADILTEFQRVLRPDGTIKLYPLYEWHLTRFRDRRLREALDHFHVQQHYIGSRGDFRVMPSMLTLLTPKKSRFS